MRKPNNIQLNDIKILNKEVSNLSVTLEVGDRVKIVGVGRRGYDLKHVSSGETVLECGWDLFE